LSSQKWPANWCDFSGDFEHIEAWSTDDRMPSHDGLDVIGVDYAEFSNPSGCNTLDFPIKWIFMALPTYKKSLSGVGDRSGEQACHDCELTTNFSLSWDT
jgi:hypothetical protein